MKRRRSDGNSGDRPEGRENARRRDRNARASLAIEGLHATPEQERLFRSFHERSLSNEERRRILAERSRRRAARRRK